MSKIVRIAFTGHRPQDMYGFDENKRENAMIKKMASLNSSQNR